MRRLPILAILGASSFARADVGSEAQALFDQGIADLKAERYEPACRELAASLVKHSDSGTKGALAVCFTKLGKVASAWQLWRDLADTAPTGELRADAADKASALEPRLPHYVVTVADAIPGLVVTVNGGAIDLGISVPLPVDPGAIAVTARAPDFEAWTQSFDVTEGKSTTIEIPRLVAHRHAVIGHAEPRAEPLPQSRHGLAIGLAAVGGALLATGAIFGVHANTKWNDAQRDCKEDVAACPGASFGQARLDFDASHSAATASDLFVIGGGVVVTAAVVTWILSRSASRERTALHLAPAIDAQRVGLAVLGAW